MSQLVAQHPLHGMLVTYDREIAALRSTQSLTGLRDPAAAALNAASAIRVDAAGAAANAEVVGSQNDAANRSREQAAAAAVLRSQRAPERSFATYSSQLASETTASLRAYGGAMGERTQRAYAARAQQLREKESTLAFDLERQNAGKRLILRLQLAELHLSPARRARLQSQLRALDALERRALDALRRNDAAELASYRSQLEGAAAAGAGAMDAQLRAKAGANYAILQKVFNEEAGDAGAFPLPSQLAAFTGGYAAQRTAQTLSFGMRSVTADVAQQFMRLGAVDAQSHRDVTSQLQTLQAERSGLYRTIVAQIQSAAEAVARERHLSAVRLVSAAPRGSLVNLTQAVAPRMAGHDSHS
ncbi:MAG: hypothetical protein JO146_06775 [Candidatus Eremiobacteraeota bacterium]|nr:hypothetical protein [Candidatus Eremiobacteraeota bacterium]